MKPESVRAALLLRLNGNARLAARGRKAGQIEGVQLHDLGEVLRVRELLVVLLAFGDSIEVEIPKQRAERRHLHGREHRLAVERRVAEAAS